MEFIGFNKIARLSRDVTITEKLDGTSVFVAITEEGEFLTGSRNRWITPEDDNFGFSRWANENKNELMKLGIGFNYGEWIGGKIQRGYGLKEKRFYLFNTFKWVDKRYMLEPKQEDKKQQCPDNMKAGLPYSAGIHIKAI
jgi:hypothetical protein